jgi:bacterioferritin
MAEKKAPVIQASQELLDKLNQAIGRELQVSIQYMWQHVQWGGIKGYTVQNELKSIAIVEMKHAEMIAERLFYLGGIPTTQPESIFVGTTLKEMLEQDVKNEEDGIHLYREIIDIAHRANDLTTHHLFEKILEDEEEHHDTFTSLLEDLD